MARTHELASTSPPYERVMNNILRYSFNNLFIVFIPFNKKFRDFKCLFLTSPGLDDS